MISAQASDDLRRVEIWLTGGVGQVSTVDRSGGGISAEWQVWGGEWQFHIKRAARSDRARPGLCGSSGLRPFDDFDPSFDYRISDISHTLG
jgi:hypothetical protein